MVKEIRKILQRDFFEAIKVKKGCWSSRQCRLSGGSSTRSNFVDFCCWFRGCVENKDISQSMAICFVSLGTVQRIPVGCRKSFCGRRERKRWEGGQSGGRVRVEMNVSIKEGYVAGGRYELLEPLGEGSTSVTYLGRDLDVEPGGKGEDVVVKVMTLKGISSWKVLELFERESRTLASISHPSIPEYLGSLQVDTEDDRIFFLVQRRAPGRYRAHETTVLALVPPISHIMF